MLGQGSIKSALSDSTIDNVLTKAFDSSQFHDQRLLVVLPHLPGLTILPTLIRTLDTLLTPISANHQFYILPPANNGMFSSVAPTSLTPRDTGGLPPTPKLIARAWLRPGELETIHTFSATEVLALTDGYLVQPVTLRLNRFVNDFDHIIVVGPVLNALSAASENAAWFYNLASAVTGLNPTHFDQPSAALRPLIVRAVEQFQHRLSLTFVALVVHSQMLHGLYVGEPLNTWRMATKLAAQFEHVERSTALATANTNVVIPSTLDS